MTAERPSITSKSWPVLTSTIVVDQAWRRQRPLRTNKHLVQSERRDHGRRCVRWCPPGQAPVGDDGVVDRCANHTPTQVCQARDRPAVSTDLFGRPPARPGGHPSGAGPAIRVVDLDPSPTTVRAGSQRRLDHTSSCRVPEDRARSTNSVSEPDPSKPTPQHHNTRHTGPGSPVVSTRTRTLGPDWCPRRSRVTSGRSTRSAHMRVGSVSTRALDSVGVKNRQNRRALTRVRGPSPPLRSEAPPNEGVTSG